MHVSVPFLCKDSLIVCCVHLFFAYSYTGGKSRVKAGLTKSTLSACEDACAQSEKLLQQIVAGDITVQRFKILWKNFSNVQRLAQAIVADKDKKSKKVKGKLTLSKEINTILPQQCKEIQKFETHFNHLYHLCQVIPPQVHGWLNNKIVQKNISMVVLQAKCGDGSMHAKQNKQEIFNPFPTFFV